MGSESGVDGVDSRCAGGPTPTSSVFPSSDFSSFSSLSASSPIDNNINNSSSNNNCSIPTAAGQPPLLPASCNTSSPASVPGNKKYLRKSSPAAAGLGVKKRGRGRARKNLPMEQELQILRSGVTTLPVMDETMPTSDCQADESAGVHCGAVYSDFNSFSNLSSSSGSFAGSTASIGKKYLGPGSPSQMPGGGCGVNGSTGSGRTKRMRTSFKHHQLKKMKSYFTMNHNPDSKALKELSIETGLSKRVLQVWFQNARAKWRRSVLRQQSAVGPDVVKEPTPLSELSDMSSSAKNQLEEIHDETEMSQTGSADPHSPTCESGDGVQRNLHSENWDNPFSHLNSQHHHHHHSLHHHPHHHMHHQLKDEESPSSFQSIHEELNHSIFNIYRPLQLF